jgi:hypothetical protein
MKGVADIAGDIVAADAESNACVIGKPIETRFLCQSRSDESEKHQCYQNPITQFSISCFVEQQSHRSGGGGR